MRLSRGRSEQARALAAATRTGPLADLGDLVGREQQCDVASGEAHLIAQDLLAQAVALDARIVGDPSTSAATSSPNALRQLRQVDSASSTTSCSRPATTTCSVAAGVAQQPRDLERVLDERLAVAVATLPGMTLHGEARARAARAARSVGGTALPPRPPPVRVRCPVRAVAVVADVRVRAHDVDTCTAATPCIAPSGRNQPRVYQCTPFMMFAIAICSTFARSDSAGAFSPFEAAESGKTL